MASDWPRIFLQPGCFCLAFIYYKHQPVKVLKLRLVFVDLTHRLCIYCESIIMKAMITIAHAKTNNLEYLYNR